MNTRPGPCIGSAYSTTSTRSVVPPLAMAPSDFSTMVEMPPALLPGAGLLSIEPRPSVAYSSHQAIRSNRPPCDQRVAGAGREEVLRAVDLGRLGEGGRAALPDDPVRRTSHDGIRGDPRARVRATALHAHDQLARGHRLATDVGDRRQQLHDRIDAGLDRLARAALLLDDERSMGHRDVQSRIIHQALELVRLAAQRQQQHAPEVRVVGVPEDGAAQQLEALARDRHGTAGGVRERDDAVDRGVIPQQPALLHVGGDEPGHARRAVHGRDEPDHVARADLAVAAADALERAVGDGTRRRGPRLRQLMAPSDRRLVRGCGRGRGRQARWPRAAWPMTSPYLRTGADARIGAQRHLVARRDVRCRDDPGGIHPSGVPAGVSIPTTATSSLGWRWMGATTACGGVLMGVCRLAAWSAGVEGRGAWTSDV